MFVNYISLKKLPSYNGTSAKETLKIAVPSSMQSLKKLVYNQSLHQVPWNSVNTASKKKIESGWELRPRLFLYHKETSEKKKKNLILRQKSTPTSFHFH